MNGIKVSVVIPFFNRIDWLREAVNSALNQTCKDIEIIIINDGSNEDLTSFLEEYENRIIYRYKDNGGPASARNIGIGIARGKYIAFLDSDDLWLPNKIELQLIKMESEKLVWSHTSYSLFNDADNRFLKNIDLAYYKGMVFPRCFGSCPVLTSCVMIRRDYLIKNDYIRFSEKMRFGQDWYMWILLAEKNRISVLPHYLTKFRVRGSNAGLRARVQIKARAQIWHFMNSKSSEYFNRKKMNSYIQLAYWFCGISNKVISRIEWQENSRSKSIELLSKILYSLPYSMLRIYENLYRRKKCDN